MIIMKHTNYKNENAVSPVIGVILMVAITVILAAIIASLVFGMASTVQKTKVVAASVSRVNATHIVAIYHGGQDASALNYITWTVNGGSAISQDPPSGTVLNVGNTLTIPADLHSHIIGVGIFTDGSMQVIADVTV